MARKNRLGLVVSENEKLMVVTLARLAGAISLASLIRMLIYQAAHHKGLLGVSIDAGKEVGHLERTPPEDLSKNIIQAQNLDEDLE